ncbi:cyclopropane-fatty-acyl-phospholipid synthase [Folsomia candida]|uniref:Cyclopropane-fatty-acyl-phospholipid synthase n=1 Tax=Folsomia candida TaxID=158441 RepID=A0A226CUW4_FOLCA|nr:cyclopropane-fatty-acyl-phospholipid synthase [Folsomia candida]OXA36773.1 Cyclopropane-fatty-acyl-phospholipid synthase [Folsomia candida]
MRTIELVYKKYTNTPQSIYYPSRNKMSCFKTFCVYTIEGLIETFRFLRYLFFLLFTPLLVYGARRFLHGKGVLLNPSSKSDQAEAITVIVTNNKFYARLCAYGDVALGEGFVEGWWDCGDLPGLCDRLMDTAGITEGSKSYKRSLPYLEAYVRWVLLNPQRNMEHLPKNLKLQYNLPTDYHRLILTDGGEHEAIQMSVVYFPTGSESIGTAQNLKLSLITSKLAPLVPGMRVLDIGCGFGAVAKHLADNYQVEVVGVTNSPGMGQAAKEHCRGSGAKIVVGDWSEIQGTFDRIIMIEMVEHVGKRNLTKFFDKVAAMLKDDGKCFIQCYETPEDFPRILEFACKYMYGPSYVPSLRELLKYTDDSGFELAELQSFAAHAAKSVSTVLEKIQANYSQIESIVGDKVARMLLLTFAFQDRTMTCGVDGMNLLVLRKRKNHKLSRVTVA